MKLENLFKYYSHQHPENIKELNDQRSLYEGLIKSYSPDELISAMSKAAPNVKIQFSKDQYTVMELRFKVPIDKDDFDRIINVVKVCGWFIATASIADDRGLDVHDKDVNKLIAHIISPGSSSVVSMIIEAKYGVDITRRILKQTWLFHIAPTQSVDKIFKLGLTPRTRSKMGHHPERIYLSTSVQGAKWLEQSFRELTKINDWTILKVDTAAFTQSGRVFVDPAYADEGVFTLSNIAPRFISIAN